MKSFNLKVVVQFMLLLAIMSLDSMASQFDAIRPSSKTMLKFDEVLNFNPFSSNRVPIIKLKQETVINDAVLNNVLELIGGENIQSVILAPDKPGEGMIAVNGMGFRTSEAIRFPNDTGELVQPIENIRILIQSINHDHVDVDVYMLENGTSHPPKRLSIQYPDFFKRQR